MAHRSFYSRRANRHERAASHARSGKDREGHLEVARGYRKLAHGSSAGSYGASLHTLGGHRKHKKHRRRTAKARAASLRNLKKAHAARRHGRHHRRHSRRRGKR